MAVMNDEADKLAKSCLKRTWKSVYGDLCASIDRRQHNIAMLHSFHLMWRDMSLEALKSSKKDEPTSAPLMPAFHVQTNQANLVTIPCVVDSAAIDKCPFIVSLRRGLSPIFTTCSGTLKPLASAAWNCTLIIASGLVRLPLSHARWSQECTWSSKIVCTARHFTSG